MHDPDVWRFDDLGTLRQLVEQPRNSAHDATFVQFRDEADLTYDQFETGVSALAGGLHRIADVRPGDRVASLLHNGRASVLTWFAVCCQGAVYVPINTAYRGDYLQHVLQDSGSKVVVVAADLVDRVLELAPALPALNTVIVDTGVITGDRENTLPRRIGDVTIRTLASCSSRSEFQPLVDVTPGDLASLVYTGGTTGPSKGCMISHNYMFQLGVYSVMGRKADEPAYTALPLFHLNAMSTVLATLLLRGRAFVANRFSVSRFWDEVLESGARFVHLLGPMAAMLAKAPDSPGMAASFGQVRRVLAAPFDAPTRAVFRERFGVSEVDAVGGYGLTEAAMVTNLPPGVQQRGGASGKRTEYMDVMIVDDLDREVPHDTVGEIVCRPCSPHVMFDGYWNRPADTLRVTRNLWFHTGDLGRIDADGYFYFVDRKKDYLRRRGENISSMELEAVFMKHAAVREVAVYGVPSDVGEDDVQISVVLEPDSTMTPEELCRWSIPRLPYFAVPRYIEITEDLLKTPVGRLRKEEMRSRDPETYDRWDRESSGIDVPR